ncbi:methyl-accepting chemotaxis protein [Kordiimonas laminariae]|uniref:methyl-accepting chemotaxis protein n=1 Tax=Kordiimonas laminariae TaxID=2917717 RepID=UPI001FF134DF|nr:methyl-accepting chemotaxis protein [Kordiimonas laminariae]MCK0069693.1 methyl-accepting chemotaxis protein [Kordiimonas laminariae]
MADISVSNVGEQETGSFLSSASARAWLIMIVAFVVIAVAFTTFNEQLGTFGTLAVIAGVIGTAAFFVGASGTGSSGGNALHLRDMEGQVNAIKKSQAVIEFNMDGTIITANENFLNAMGYSLFEVQGKHHSMFAEPAYAASAEYRAFWEKLGRGEFEAGEFKRLGKGGREVWIQASYNPIFDEEGRPFKVVKYAVDVTDQKKQSADFEGQIEAIGKSQAVIEFNMDGTIITANDNFLQTMGYALHEIQGQHHRMFADPILAASPEYAAFWEALNRGEFASGEYKRLGKGAKEVWINASYNPIMDLNGNPFKVVKYASDITAQKLQAAKDAFNARIKVALDSATTNVMLADTNFNIFYMNESMVAMMKNAEADLKKDLPNFNADTLIGTNIDGFHKDPSHQRSLVGKLDRTYETQIKVGGRTFDLIANPVMGEDGNRIGTSVEWADITERLARELLEKKEAAQNAQIKQALDKVTANVMVADAEMGISYMNESMQSMFKTAETDIRQVLPSFDASNLIGQNPDIFHQNPAHQRGLITNLAATHSTEISVGSRKFTLIANPVHNAEGERLGTVVEWGDVTAERNVESEINAVVDAAVAGDLSQRVDLNGKDGFLLNVSKGINEFAETCAQGLGDVAHMLEAMAMGDLTKRITNEYHGTFDELKRNSNEAAEKLSEALSQISVGADEVSNASTEIASGSADLSQRTEQQASSLEETAASMEEMEGAVKTNADNAKEANSRGLAARGVAENGGAVVDKAVSAMSRIEESSQKISDIIGVIDEIAFQTNLLALNAAVEAARAGDAGKGFAVVASEVRALAQRSSEAAKDIKSLIVDSNTQVKDGVELVNEAGTQLREIVDSIKTVTELVSEIASANQEQATGIAEINRAVAEMDEMTQQNSALVEETAASGRSLEEQAELMRERVSFFRIDGIEQPKIVSPVSRPAPSQPAPVRAAPAPKPTPAAAALDDDDDWAEF